MSKKRMRDLLPCQRCGLPLIDGNRGICQPCREEMEWNGEAATANYFRHGPMAARCVSMARNAQRGR